MQFREHNFRRRFSLFVHHLGRNAAPVVDHCDRSINVDDGVDLRAVAR